MSHKIQVTLTDRQFDALKSRKRSQHSSLAELIRRAVESEYLAEMTVRDRLDSIRAGAGAWKRPDSFDPVKEVKKLRKPLGPLPPRG